MAVVDVVDVADADVVRKKLLKNPPAFIVDVEAEVAGLLDAEVAVDVPLEECPEAFSRSLCVVEWWWSLLRMR